MVYETDIGGPQAACPCLSRVGTDNSLEVRFSATLGEEPDVEVALCIGGPTSLKWYGQGGGDQRGHVPR